MRWHLVAVGEFQPAHNAADEDQLFVVAHLVDHAVATHAHAIDAWLQLFDAVRPGSLCQSPDGGDHTVAVGKGYILCISEMLIAESGGAYSRAAEWAEQDSNL